jgi:hypothetical protein
VLRCVYIDRYIRICREGEEEDRSFGGEGVGYSNYHCKCIGGFSKGTQIVLFDDEVRRKRGRSVSIATK